MGEGWTTAVYLLLGLGLVAALYYAVTQITARQRRLEADLARLERLSAEVAMSAEAILERVDERIEQLQALADQVEAKVEARAEAGREMRAGGPRRARADAPRKAEAEPKASKRAGKRSAAGSEEPAVPAAPVESPSFSAPPAAEVAATPPGPGEYETVRAAVFAMADAGREPHEIAQAVGVPRGEVQLILNLRGRKATV